MLNRLLPFVLIALGGVQALAQSIDKPIYMGKAATGESVWYYGGELSVATYQASINVGTIP